MKGPQELRWLLSLFAVALAGMAVGACGASDEASRPATAPATVGADATVSIVDMSFSPAAINIRVGEAVEWVWDDGRIEHDVVFQGGPASERRRTGTWQLTFDRAGTYTYVCTLHPTMTGRILVE